MIGRIVKVLSNDFTVKINDEYIVCKARGNFKNKNIIPLSGDIVEIDKEKKIIEKILPRSNYLIRPPVSNVDVALIVVSAVNPDFSTNLLDKMINIIEFNNIKPVIIITKYDLLNETNIIDDYITYYKNIGYKVFINDELDEIKKIFNNKVVILTGQTGVGKSTLINKLEDNLNLKTGEISKALGRGKHTTRHVELFEIGGGLIADTPGFSSLSFIGMTKNDIKDNFIEFNNYSCKYRDCMHIKEDECEIKNKVQEGKIISSRYNNYVKFIEEKEKEQYTDKIYVRNKI